MNPLGVFPSGFEIPVNIMDSLRDENILFESASNMFISNIGLTIISIQFYLFPPVVGMMMMSLIAFTSIYNYCHDLHIVSKVKHHMQSNRDSIIYTTNNIAYQHFNQKYLNGSGVNLAYDISSNQLRNNVVKLIIERRVVYKESRPIEGL